jgi:hypothetical protein
MSEPQFPTREQVERRTDQIIEGIGYPHLPALPGIAFRRLTLVEKGDVSRGHSAFLFSDMAKGGRFSEPLLMTELRRRCLEVGLNYDQLMAQEEEFERRIFDRAPANLRDLAKRLSEEEIMAMAPEARTEYIEQLKRRNAEVEEYIRTLFTPEEQITRGQAKQVEKLYNELRALTYEHHARVRQRCLEILHGARRPADGAPPSEWPAYFSSLEEIYELEDVDQSTWLALAAKWREFKEGKWPGFTRRSSSTPTPGV